MLVKANKTLREKNALYTPTVTTRNNNEGGQKQYKDDVRIAMLDDVLESDSPMYAEKPMTKK